MTSHAQAHGQAPASGHGHERNYVKIWGILLVLLVISVVGPMAGIRVVTLITAFGIALVKAYIVAKNFMHLDIEKPIVHWMLLVGLTPSDTAAVITGKLSPKLGPTSASVASLALGPAGARSTPRPRLPVMRPDTSKTAESATNTPAPALSDTPGPTAPGGVNMAFNAPAALP